MHTKKARRVVPAIVCLIATLLLIPKFSRAQEDAAQKVRTSMALLQSGAAKLGSAKIEGMDRVAGQEVPAIYFGGTKMNNNFDLVDDIVKNAGGTATVFVKSGNDYIRVATNVKIDDGSRAVGTTLDPNGKVIVNIRNGEAFYGEATILGKSYTAGYEPIRDSANNVIGIYYVGYPQDAGLVLTGQEAAKWVGKPVYSSDGKNLGEVASFERGADNKVTEMHADIGGFLGLGEHHVRLMPSQIKLQGDRVVLNLTSAQAKELPKIPR